MGTIVVGNTFPMTLIRGHRVTVEELPISRLRELAMGRKIRSFWGHTNSLAAAEAVAGISLAPRTERPTVTLDEDRLPTLDGEGFAVCYVLSPDYAEAVRPAIGAEYATREIAGWHLLRLTWTDTDRRESIGKEA